MQEGVETGTFQLFCTTDHISASYLFVMRFEASASLLDVDAKYD